MQGGRENECKEAGKMNARENEWKGKMNGREK